MTPVHSVVVPVFNEEECIRIFHTRAESVLTGIEGDFEIVYVDDGSRDSSWSILEGIQSADPHVRLVRLSRNFGHQVAITAGMELATGDTVTVIDADLQDPPEVIPDLIAAWVAGADVVYAVRSARAGESWFKRASASAFYRTLRWLADVDIPADAGDFRLMSRKAVEAIKAMPERSRFIRGMVAWVGYRTATIEYQREGRAGGTTKYPFGKMLKLAVDGILSFSIRPLRIATWTGGLSALAALIYAGVVICMRLFGNIPVEGWTSLVVVVLFLGGLQLLTIGVLGEYIGRVHAEVRGRPLFLLDEVRGFQVTPQNQDQSSASRQD